MRIIAPMMILIMMTSTLAGCTGGDPDSGGEMDSDAINDLIDQNLQDFINNTTITVNQEIHHHYYNNTTTNDYTVEYNNTTVNEGDSIVNEGDDNNLNEWSNTSYNLGGASFGNGVNGTVSMGASMMFVAHVEFDAYDIFPDFESEPGPDRDNFFTYIWEYYDYLSNSNRTDAFTFSCQVFYLIGSQSNNSQVSFFDNEDNYHDAWSNEYNGTVANLLSAAGQDSTIRGICEEGYVTSGALSTGEDDFEYTFFSIEVPIGYSIQYIQLDTNHDHFGCYLPITNSGGCLNLQYEEYRYRNYTSSINFIHSQGPNPNDDNYFGGWDNLTIDFSLSFEDPFNRTDYNSDSPTFYQDVEVVYHYNAIWPTSEFDFTLYYQFVPVIPTE